MPGGRAGIARGRNNLRGRGEWLARLPPRQRTRLSGRQATQQYRPRRPNAESLHARTKARQSAVACHLSAVVFARAYKSAAVACHLSAVLFARAYKSVAVVRQRSSLHARTKARRSLVVRRRSSLHARTKARRSLVVRRRSSLHARYKSAAVACCPSVVVFARKLYRVASRTWVRATAAVVAVVVAVDDVGNCGFQLSTSSTAIPLNAVQARSLLR